MSERRCTKCGGPGPFYACKRHRDGLASWCKACSSATTMAIANRKYAEDPIFRDAAKARSRAARMAMTPEERERNRSLRRMWARARKYGITREQFEAMLVEQAENCGICGTRMACPCVDHDHATGAVRGLLCFSCNTALGHLRDDPAILRRALVYLTKLRALPTTQEA